MIFDIKETYWINKNREIQNPYFGDKVPLPSYTFFHRDASQTKDKKSTCRLFQSNSGQFEINYSRNNEYSH